MKYQVQQISYNFCTFQDIEECTWDFNSSEIYTDTGYLDILGFMEVEQNGQVGVQMNVNGLLDLGRYSDSSTINTVHITTLAVMRQPHNIWLWVYMFDDSNQPVAAFCGTEGIDKNNGFAKYVMELKRFHSDSGTKNYEESAVYLSDDFVPSAEENVTDLEIGDGIRYKGWGCYHDGMFVPHGCGKKKYPDFYAYGNFKKGELNGPALISHDYYMYTVFHKNNRGNGWGLCINRGLLVEFGYYENSQLKTDLIDVVQWYFDECMRNSNRVGENMMNMYTSKTTHEVVNLLIGYTPKNEFGRALPCVGFRFKPDGSVWMGTGYLGAMTGYCIHFTPDGHIEIGKFKDNILVQRLSLQELINIYIGTPRIGNDESIGMLVRTRIMSNISDDAIEEYREIEEPKTDYSYFTEEYDDDGLPF